VIGACMSDSGADKFFEVVGGLVLVVGLVYGGSGAGPTASSGAPGTSTDSTTRINRSSTSSRSTPSTNIPGGPLMMCSGTVIKERSHTNSSGTLTVRVYYSPYNGGRNCAVATTGESAFSGPRGVFKINLHFTAYHGSRWPKYAHHTSSASASRSGAVYVTNADNRCIVSTATFTPRDGGKKIKVTSGRTGCK
jgi:hypothetical protein